MWFDKVQAADCLGIKPVSLKTVEGIETVRRKKAPRPKSMRGRTPVLFAQKDIEKLREKRQEKTPTEKKPMKPAKKKPTTNQRKVTLANKTLKERRSKHTALDVLTRNYIVALKEVDPSISVVRVHVERRATELFGDL